MFETPQKISLVAQTQAIVIAGMRQRRWQRTLPGERALSRELRVSRWTLRTALAELARLGYLKITQGMPCKIRSKVLATAPRQATARKVALLTPAPLSGLRQFVGLWIDDLRVILNAQGIDFSVHSVAAAYQSKPTQALEDLVGKYPDQDWILLLSTRRMQKWFQSRGEYVLIVGSRFEGVHLPAIDIAAHAVGVHAGHMLLDMGHRRLTLIMPRVPSVRVLAAETGLRQTISKASCGATLTVAPVSDDTGDICRTIDRLLGAAARSSVLISAHAPFALSALSEIIRLGLRVPQDISLLSLDSEPFLNMVVPPIARYEISSRQVAMSIARVVFGHATAQSGTIELTPKFAPAESLRRMKPQGQ